MTTSIQRIVDAPTRIDLHIHSAASTCTKDAGNVALSECTKENLDVLLKALDLHKVNMCSITDHDCFDYDLYLALKGNEGRGYLKKVLPGIEFSVSVADNQHGITVIHIVAIFDDGDQGKVAGISDFVCDDNGHPRYDDPSNNAFTEDGLAGILRSIGLDCVLIGHEKSAGQESQRDVSSLGIDKANEVILTEFIDAVEIKNRRKELDIKRLISLYPRNDVAFVIGTDCHNWSDYPSSSEGDTAFSSLKCLPSFRGLVMAITDSSRIHVGESAFFGNSAATLNAIDLVIDGEEVSIPLSRGINAIVGDNSIGKSLLLHAITSNKWLTDTDAQQGYQSYCNREALSIRTVVPESIQFKFDDQDSVRKTLEELHTGASSSDYFLPYFQMHVDIDSLKQSLKRHMERCARALQSKTKFNDALEKVADYSVGLQIHLRTEVLSIGNSMSNVSFEAIDGLISKIKIEIDNVSAIQTDYARTLIEIPEADDYLAKAVGSLKKAKIAVEKRRRKYEVEDAVKKALNASARKEKDSLGKKKTDEEEAKEAYEDSLSKAAQSISELVLLKAQIFNHELSYSPDVQTSVPNPMGKFIFVSETTAGKAGSEYVNKMLAVVFNQPQLNQIKAGITGDTSLKTRDVCAFITGTSPAETACYGVIISKFNDLIEGISERRKITNQEIGIDGEPSAGLYGRLYFDLLAENDTNQGIYFIDQPEDQISQMAIREHVLDAFRKMGSRRQILMITHNPQFVVNLDVDNVIVLSRKKDGPQRIEVRSGALEYECSDYRMLDLIADTVEGGADVVRMRLKRYGSNASNGQTGQ